MVRRTTLESIFSVHNRLRNKVLSKLILSITYLESIFKSIIKQLM